MSLVTWYHRASKWLTDTRPGRVVATLLIMSVVSVGGLTVDHLDADAACVGTE